MNSLLEFWNECSLESAPYVHPRDVSLLKKHGLFDDEVSDNESFVKGPRFGNFDDARFHLSLLPVPYIGLLDKADIFLLLLNPGFGLSDYVVNDDEEHSAEVRAIIRQDANIEFPFISLNPKFVWTGGFRWWEQKLRNTVLRIAEAKGGYLQGLKSLSQRLAAIELVPYHSQKFGAGKIVSNLPSSQAAMRFVSETLVPRARRGHATIIVTRKVASWGLPTDCEHVVLYEKALTRNAPLGPDTPGGQAILQRYGLC
jgi:hypothetical protein